MSAYANVLPPANPANCGRHPRPCSSSDLSPRSGGRQLHHFKCGTAKDSVRIAERLGHLKMVVALADDQLDGLAGFLECSSEVARLPLKFRCLQGTVR